MSETPQEPKPTITVDDPRVVAIAASAEALIYSSEELLMRVRNFKGETGKSIATPAEIFYVSGVSRMIEAFTRDIQGRLDAINK